MWPSQNVAQGGIFQPPRVKYSQETKDFLKVLIEESKLSSAQRKQVNESIRNGTPLPRYQDMHSPMPSGKNRREKITIRPGSSKRRMFTTIVNSGAYEREKFKPTPKIDREMAKRHLQDLMTFGKELKKKNENEKKKKPNPNEGNQPIINRFDELKQEIEERRVWLEEMEKLGEGEKHRLIIKQQIEARLREMEKLKIQEDTPIPTERSTKTTTRTTRTTKTNKIDEEGEEKTNRQSQKNSS